MGMNTMANKLYALNKLVSLDMLNVTFVHFKKLAKIRFFLNMERLKLNPELCNMNVPYKL